MRSVEREACVVTTADLRRSTAELLKRAEAGESIVIQRRARPVAVLLDYGWYARVMEIEEKLENLELLLLARRRAAALVRGEDELVSLEEMMAEFGSDPRLS